VVGGSFCSSDVLTQACSQLQEIFEGVVDLDESHSTHRPFEHSGSLVKGREKTVTDGPFPETKEIVGGYTLIEPRTLEQAVELSKNCPILEVDGAVEVRPVLKLNM
jgi:hypothetical protein